MSTSTDKRLLAAAIKDAEAFRAMFPPNTYSRWEIAGSVRRQADRVGDVEHVVQPIIAEVADSNDLFATPKPTNLFLARFDELLATYQVDRHIYGHNPKTAAPLYRWGKKYRGADFRGFNHEVFACDPDGSNWGPTLAIRTGPGSFSQMLVTKLQRNGHMNADGYVWCKRDMTCASCGWTGTEDQPSWKTQIEIEDARVYMPPNWDGKTVISKDPDGRDGGPFYAFCPACRHSSGMGHRRVSVPTEQEYFALCGVAWLEPRDRKEIL